jgi:hypothetical protein
VGTKLSRSCGFSTTGVDVNRIYVGVALWDVDTSCSAGLDLSEADRVEIFG